MHTNIVQNIYLGYPILTCSNYKYLKKCIFQILSNFEVSLNKNEKEIQKNGLPNPLKFYAYYSGEILGLYL
jgi:hypothetical protein